MATIQRTRDVLLALSLLAFVNLLCGCSTQINLDFPQVAPEKPAVAAAKVGVAPVQDSRASHVAGPLNMSSDIFRSVSVATGPELPDYIGNSFRNGLVKRGFDPIEAPDPGTTALQQPYKVLVITIQSVTFADSGLLSFDGASSLNLAVQVFSGGPKPVFAKVFNGECTEHIPAWHGGKKAVSAIIATAADRAVEAALASPDLREALR